MTVIVPRQSPTQPIGVPAPDRSTTDPLSTPRAVLPRAVVAAAVASLPTLSPVLLPHEPEYCLAAKRKAADIDHDDADDAPRAIKKPKNDQQEALFGPLNTPPQADAPQPSPFDIAIEQAIAAALYVFPPDARTEPAPIAVDAPSLVDQLAIQYPSHVHPPLALAALGDGLPAEDPAAQTWQEPPVPGFFPGDVSPQPVAGPSSSAVPPPVVAIEGIDILPEQPQPVPAAAAEPEQACGKPKRNESLWATACRDRMRTIIGLCGTWESLRVVLGEPSKVPKPAEQPEAQPQDDSAKSVSGDSRSGASDTVPEDLPMEIYTPSNFSSEEESDEEAEREATESEIEEAADMSFDLDEDRESDYEDYEDGCECDPSSIEPDEHESIMEVTFEQPSTPSVPLSSPPPPELPPTPAPVATIQISSTPELPRLATFRALGIREWIIPDLNRGTPRRVHPSHCGVLTREHLHAAAQRDRDAWRAMWQ
ncbi:hypothetical protein PsYK624_016870 [Phanerochaete sordida]|uniref:Uncharacterized protein n=1 Tax=Phanerochaete sordida TaxID=48140 RepID=A0A9P3FYK1_9APHY|nr:hypothetical protein PsYK624_016870 [Phanerochaete sordida]